MKRSCLAIAMGMGLAATAVHATDVKGGTAPSTSVGKVKAGDKAGGAGTVKGASTGVVFLTEQECTRLGGTVTTGVPNDATCKTNTRCKTVLANGDIRSICVDELAP